MWNSEDWKTKLTQNIISVPILKRSKSVVQFIRLLYNLVYFFLVLKKGFKSDDRHLPSKP